MSIWVTASLKYLPRVCSQEKQALHVAIHGAVIGVIGGIAPIVWGYVVRNPDGSPGVLSSAFMVYFACLAVIQIGLLAYVSQLTSQHRDRPSLQMGSIVLRPFRYLGQMTHLSAGSPNPKRPDKETL